MHDIGSAYNQLDRKVVEDPELLGKECLTCNKILAYSFFRRDASYRDGVRDQCQQCESAPRLSTEEHTHRLRELNHNSEAVKKQRWAHQEEYQNAAAREGRRMSAAEFMVKISGLVPSLFFDDGRIKGDIAVYRTYGQPQPHLDGRTYEYLWYIPAGMMPEFSIYEFNERDVPVREKERGWRTPLLRLIQARLITEEQADRVFGKATGAGSHVWYRKLYELRNNTTV